MSIKYTTDNCKIVEIKGPVDLVYIKMVPSGQKKFCSKKELSPFLIQQYRDEIKGEGGEQL